MRVKSSDRKKVDKEVMRLLKRRMPKKTRSNMPKIPEFRMSPKGPIERK
jgi:hypothetical protein